MKSRRIINSRAPIERFARIAGILNAANGPVPAHKLAAVFEVSTRTITRDLEFMRDRLDLPIESHMGSHGSGGYTFSRPVRLCPVCQRSHE